MPFVDYPQQILGFTIRKRLGLPNMFGWIVFGWSEFGDDNEFAGVYQQRHKRKGYWYNGELTLTKPKNFMMKPAWPSQPVSVARDAQQAKFKTALSMWQALTNDEKKVYNRIATKLSRRGYDYFMSKTLKSL